MLVCFVHPPAVMSACECEVYLVCMRTDTNNDLITVRQQCSNSAQSQQTYLTFLSLCVYIKTVFLQPEYNCIIFSCFACLTDCFCMQQVMTKEII